MVKFIIFAQRASHRLKTTGIKTIKLIFTLVSMTSVYNANNYPHDEWCRAESCSRSPKNPVRLPFTDGASSVTTAESSRSLWFSQHFVYIRALYSNSIQKALSVIPRAMQMNEQRLLWTWRAGSHLSHLFSHAVPRNISLLTLGCSSGKRAKGALLGLKLGTSRV